MIQWCKMPKHRWALLITALLLALSMIGCVEMPDTAQTLSSQPVGEVHGTRIVGQTFVASHNGLSRIDIQLATYARCNTQPVIFHLRSDPSAATDIATITFEAEEVVDNAYCPFRFPPIPDSQGRSFYFLFESTTSKPGDAITLWHNPDDVYPDGQIYIQGKPQSGDMVFKTFYTYGLGAILRDLYTGAKTSFPLIPLVALLYLLPGYALLQLLAPDLDLDLPQRIILSVGLTVALMPLLLLVASWAGLKFGRLMTALLLAGAGLIALWRTDFGNWRSSARQLGIVDASLGAIFLLALVVRLLVVRDVIVPMWGDSYHHTMIAQLLVDHGGLFDSWQPYAPLTSFTYHFGFHTNVAFLHWLTGLGVIRSVIWAGQFLNALAVLALYPLAIRVSNGDRWAGVCAVLIGGLLSSMPMYYVNWGRYTQLTGQVILPVAMLLTWDALEREQCSYGLSALTAMTVAGLALIHYRVLLMYVCSLPPLVLLRLWRLRGDPAGIRDLAVRVGLLGLVSLLIILPWMWRSLAGLLPRWLVGMVQHGSQSRFVQETNAFGQLSYFTSLAVLATGVVGGVWGLVRRQRGVVLVLAWVILLLILSNPNAVGLLGMGIVNNFTLLIAIYMPVSLLGGYLASEAVEWATRNRARAIYPIVAVLITLALWGGRDRLAAVDEQQFGLVTEADMQAMAWIRENTAPDAKFLVNSFFAYGGSVIVGADAGWWIPLLTRRGNTVPPITYCIETGEEANYIAKVNDFARQVQGADMDDPAVLSLLQEQQVTHVFIGQKQGRVNYAGNAVLDAEVLENSPHYRAVYHQDGVWIFEGEHCAPKFGHEKGVSN